MSQHSLRHPRDYMQAAVVVAIVACVLGASGCSQDFQGPSDSLTGNTALISDLIPASYETARLREGDRYYLDRDLTLTSVPPGYDDWLWIRTADADREASADSFISFGLMEGAVVAVAYDRRATALPDWLAGWREAPSGIGVTDTAASPLRVFYQHVEPGQVVLGGNLAPGAMGAQSMYVTLLLSQSAREPAFLEIDFSSVDLAPDETVQFTAATFDQVGEPISGQIDWTATGGAITSNGLYTAGQTPGNYSVTATEARTGVSGSSGVTINDPGGGGSGHISGVTWACNSLITDAPGSDLWPITWSDDGHQYTAWGDGNGFDSGSRFGYGISRVEGSPTNYVATDVSAYSPGGDGGKIGSIISVNGVLYFHFNKQDGSPPNQALRKSTDHGVTLSGDIFTWPDKHILKFINHGQDNSLAGGYVYASVGEFSTTDPIYLVRVAEADIETRAAWQWWTGAGWGARTARTPIFTEVGGPFGAIHTTITYIPATREYLLFHVSAANVGHFGVYTGPNPYGPWTLTEKYDAGNLWPCANGSVTEMLPRHIAPKWLGSLSGGAIPFWMIFSGTGSWDRWNEVQGTLTVN